MSKILNLSTQANAWSTRDTEGVYSKRLLINELELSTSSGLLIGIGLMEEPQRSRCIGGVFFPKSDLFAVLSTLLEEYGKGLTEHEQAELMLLLIKEEHG